MRKIKKLTLEEIRNLPLTYFGFNNIINFTYKVTSNIKKSTVDDCLKAEYFINYISLFNFEYKEIDNV